MICVINFALCNFTLPSGWPSFKNIYNLVWSLLIPLHKTEEKMYIHFDNNLSHIAQYPISFIKWHKFLVILNMHVYISYWQPLSDCYTRAMEFDSRLSQEIFLGWKDLELDPSSFMRIMVKLLDSSNEIRLRKVKLRLRDCFTLTI